MEEDRSLPRSPRGVSGFSDLEVIYKSAPRKSERQVFFQLDSSSSSDDDHDHDAVLCAKPKCSYAPLRTELSQEEMTCMYYTKQEFKTFKQEARKMAQLSEDDESQRLYLRTFMNMYHTQTPGKDNEEELVSRILASDLVCLPLATAPVRGLEKYIFPGLFEDQRRVVQSVLKAQETISPNVQNDTQACILASTSSILSRQTRHLARTMAHADSIVALSIYRRTFLPTSQSANKKKINDNHERKAKSSGVESKKLVVMNQS